MSPTLDPEASILSHQDLRAAAGGRIIPEDPTNSSRPGSAAAAAAANNKAKKSPAQKLWNSMRFWKRLSGEQQSDQGSDGKQQHQQQPGSRREVCGSLMIAFLSHAEVCCPFW